MTSDAISKSLERGRRRAPTWVMPATIGGMAVIDGLAAILSFTLAFYIRESAPLLSETAWAWSKEFVPYSGVVFFLVFIRVAANAQQRLYRLHGSFSYLDQIVRIFKATVLASLSAVAFTFMFRGGTAFREFSYSRGVFLIDFFIALILYSAIHLGFRLIQSQIRNRGYNLIPTLIVGTEQEAASTVKELERERAIGYRVVGIVTTNGDAPSDVCGVPVVGAVDRLSDIIRDVGAQEVIITDASLPSDFLFETMMRVGRKQKVEFRLAPSLLNMLPQKTSIEQVGILPMLKLLREPLTDAERIIKRILDLVVAGVCTVALSPLMLVIAVLVRLESKGGVFFRQERVGMDGRIFLCLKFRSMSADSGDEVHRETYLKNIQGDATANVGDESAPVFGKVKDDPRITRVGRLLRRTSLDELPQLLNVLKGEMSVVGPRPPIPYEVEAYETWHRKRLDMKPGITGLWQVSGRNRLNFEEMVRLDLYYIENWSVLLDLKILLLTLPAVFRGDGAK